MTVHVKMWRAAGVSVCTPRRLPGNEISDKQNDYLNKKNKKLTVRSMMRFAKNPNFYSTSNRHGIPSVLTKTKVLDATGFPATEKDEISILFEDQLCNCSHRDP